MSLYFALTVIIYFEINYVFLRVNQFNMASFLFSGSDPENTLRDAFAMFDPDGSGKLAEDYLKDLLSNTGDLFSKDELKQTWKNTPIEGGMIDYKQFTQIIKGKEDE